MKNSSPGSELALPRATGQASARRNLISHLIIVANQHVALATFGGEPSDSDVLGKTYLSALQHLVGLLDPCSPRFGFDSPENAERSLRQLRSVWTEVVVEDSDPSRANKASAFAHQLLTRFPNATAFYVNECAHTFPEPQIALDLIAQASRHLTFPAEGALLGRAQTYAMQTVLRRKKIEATPEPVAGEVQSISSVIENVLKTVPALPESNLVLTESHRAALDRIVAMGQIFYERPANTSPISLRLYPMLVGPTGAGKSRLVREAALCLNAELLKLCRGDWLPRGVRPGRATVFTILDRLLASERLCLNIEEADKFDLDFSKEWSAGIGTCLWQTLDGNFQIEDYLSETNFGDRPVPTKAEIERKIRSLWIIGSGTWQSVFTDNARSANFGFQKETAPAQVNVEAIVKSGAISPELLLRFNADLVIVNYPAPHEIAGLLDATGITAQAKELGMVATASDVNWKNGGMRVLETLATRLAIEKHRRSKLPPSRMEARFSNRVT